MIDECDRSLPRELTVLQMKAKMMLMKQFENKPKAAPTMIKRSKRKEYTKAFSGAKDAKAKLSSKVGGLWKKNAHQKKEKEGVLGKIKSTGAEHQQLASRLSRRWKNKAQNRVVEENQHAKEAEQVIQQLQETGVVKRELASSVSLKWKVQAKQKKEKEDAMRLFLANEAEARRRTDREAEHVLEAFKAHGSESRQRTSSMTGKWKIKARASRKEKEDAERDEAERIELAEFQKAKEDAVAVNSADVLRVQLAQMAEPPVKTATFYETMMAVADKRKHFRKQLAIEREKRATKAEESDDYIEPPTHCPKCGNTFRPHPIACCSRCGMTTDQMLLRHKQIIRRKSRRKGSKSVLSCRPAGFGAHVGRFD